jgi:acyl-CoA thioesterase I
MRGFVMAKEIDFVAIGDSLTVGYISSPLASQPFLGFILSRLASRPYFGFIRSCLASQPYFGFIRSRLARSIDQSRCRPYSNFLEEYAGNFLKELGRKDTIQIRIINKGVNGDLTSNMLLRFTQDVVELKPDYVIILGGANDVDFDFPAEEIFFNLERMFEKAMDNGIKPVGCTLPSVLGHDEWIPSRLELNRLLTRFCQVREIPCADLFTATCDPKTKRLRSDYSSDFVHLNISGYRKIAETIFEESVKSVLVSELNIGD